MVERGLVFVFVQYYSVSIYYSGELLNIDNSRVQTKSEPLSADLEQGRSVRYLVTVFILQPGTDFHLVGWENKKKEWTFE
jgi:hypothetical protein